MASKRPAVFRIITVLFVICSLWAGTMLLDWPSPWGVFAGKPFNRCIWLAAAGDETPLNPRTRMVWDVMINHLSAGMSREDVINILGQPDYSAESARFRYRVGMASGFGIDDDTLDIHFCQSGQVAKYKLFQH